MPRRQKWIIHEGLTVSQGRQAYTTNDNEKNCYFEMPSMCPIVTYMISIPPDEPGGEYISKLLMGKLKLRAVRTTQPISGRARIQVYGRPSDPRPCATCSHNASGIRRVSSQTPRPVAEAESVQLSFSGTGPYGPCPVQVTGSP